MAIRACASLFWRGHAGRPERHDRCGPDVTLRLLNQAKAIKHLSGFKLARIYLLGSLDEAVAQDLRQSGIAHLACSGLAIVRHAHIDQHIAVYIECAVAGGRIVIVRLSDGADDSEPTPLREQRNFNGLHRLKPAYLSGR